MKNILRILLGCITLCGIGISAIAQISGNVYRDLNADGQQNTTEAGLSGIRVSAYNLHNQRIASTTTDAQGNYRLDVPVQKQVRVSFDDLPSHYVPTPSSHRHATDVKFVTSPQTHADLGLYDPHFFVSPKQTVAVPLYTVGNHQSSVSDSLSGIMGFDLKTSEKIRLATDKEVGAIWGLAYHQSKNLLFSSAIAKRHVGYGSLGTGGIYVTNLQTKTTKPFINLNDLGIDTGKDTHEGLGNDINSKSLDAKIFDQIGKISLGGIDLSEDEKTLYVMNLFDRTLYGITLPEKGIPTAQDVRAYPIPNLGNEAGDNRPFAVKYYHSKVYVGIVNDAQKSQDATFLSAQVLALDLEKSTFQTIVSIPLNYAKGKIAEGVERTGWYPWTDQFDKAILPASPSTAAYPQPILSDIEFDTDGTIILGLMDRFGHQSGTGQPTPNGDSDVTGMAAGDILRVSFATSNLPSNANSKSDFIVEIDNTFDKTTISDGNWVSAKEFYSGDTFKRPQDATAIHEESGLGALVLLPETNQVLNSVHEPTGEYNTNGFKWLSNQTGVAQKGVELYLDGQPGTFSKTNGIGDLELINIPPPMEIGNRVWIDANNNGIQDPEEKPMAGVQLELYEGPKQVGITSTNILGEYVFNSSNVKGGLKPKTHYQIRTPHQQNSQTLVLSKTKTGNNDAIDNDGIDTQDFVKIDITTGNLGENKYSYDLGFQCSNHPSVSTQVVVSQIGETKEANVVLNGFHSDYRIDFYQGEKYIGENGFDEAAPIAQNGVVFSSFMMPKFAQVYTFRVFDNKGCYSDVSLDLKTTSTENNEGLLVVYPNPAVAQVKVEYRSPNNASEVTLQVFDLLGRNFQKQIVSGNDGFFSTIIEVNKLTAGNYLLSVQDGGKTTLKVVTKE